MIYYTNKNDFLKEVHFSLRSGYKFIVIINNLEKFIEDNNIVNCVSHNTEYHQRFYSLDIKNNDDESYHVCVIDSKDDLKPGIGEEFNETFKILNYLN